MEVIPSLAPRTAEKVTTVLDAVERILKPKKLAALTASELSTFVAELRDGTRTESTILSYVAHLRSALSWAAGIGLLSSVPKMPKPKRAKVHKKPKGRAPTEEEYKQILEAVPQIVGQERADSWRQLIEGLWSSGLRLGEALELWWDRDDKLRIDFQGDRPLLRIPAELEKGHQDRLLPVAPEFAELLSRTPLHKRTGRVFDPKADRICGEALTLDRVSKIISRIGAKAGVVVHVETRTGNRKYASAHDFRRAFGDRWALRVMPAILMQLMRHESIDTTMKYYVGRHINATMDVVWEAYEKAVHAREGGDGQVLRDTLRDTNEDGPGKKKGL
jgi:integrase